MRHVSEFVQHEVFTPGVEDEHGNEVDGWASPVPLGIYAYNPGGTSEPFVPGHDRVITVPSILVPSGSVVGPHDRVTVRGVRFEVDGALLDFRNPMDESMNGCVVNLKAVDS